MSSGTAIQLSDASKGFTLKFDASENAVVLHAWLEDMEVAFARIPVEAFMLQSGLADYVQSQVLLQLANRLKSKSAKLHFEAEDLEREAARLRCPFTVGDIVHANGIEHKGRFQVHSILLKHCTWWITAFKVSDGGIRRGMNLVSLSSKDNLRIDPI